MPANPKFIESLGDQPWISPREAQALAVRFKDDGMAMLQSLVEQFPNRMDDLGKLWGDSLGVAYVPPAKSIIQYDVVRRLPKAQAMKHVVLPIYEFDNVATVAAASPEDTETMQAVESALNCFVSPVFAFPQQIKAVLEIAYLTKDQLSAMLAIPEDGSGDERLLFARLGKLAQDKAISEFTRGMFLLAIRNRASDIHIEPARDAVRIRFRQDGTLQEALKIDLTALPSLVNHIKILAGADIAENRKPQDGRISIPLQDREVDVRFSCVPAIYGEKIVLRILGQTSFSAIPEIEELSLSKSVHDDMVSIISAPNGIFFITGPTGSGKTTTLFSALKRLNRPGINIMTIEDPVEYRLPGLNQVQVNVPAGVTFAGALRAFLRQDPDVILIGEIRDLETASIAAQAALTGHLVMATMHTNSALQAVTRLIQIGVEPFLVAPSLIGVMAQRLVRKLCDECKERYALTQKQIERYFDWDGSQKVEFCRAVGCERCAGTGYFGRMAIHELFIIDEETRDLIGRNASILDIQQHAYSKGFKTLRYDGFKKVLRGLTTPDEVDRVVMEVD